MRLTSRIGRLERWAEEWSLWHDAERLASELGGGMAVEQVAADLRRGRARFRVLLAHGLSVEDALRRFAEEEGLDSEELLAEAERLAAKRAQSRERSGRSGRSSRMCAAFSAECLEQRWLRKEVRRSGQESVHDR